MLKLQICSQTKNIIHSINLPPTASTSFHWMKDITWWNCYYKWSCRLMASIKKYIGVLAHSNIKKGIRCNRIVTESAVAAFALEPYGFLLTRIFQYRSTADPVSNNTHKVSIVYWLIACLTKVISTTGRTIKLPVRSYLSNEVLYRVYLSSLYKAFSIYNAFSLISLFSSNYPFQSVFIATFPVGILPIK